MKHTDKDWFLRTSVALTGSIEPKHRQILYHIDISFERTIYADCS